jgi:uncharacterized protein YbdZ (MbtH family)
MEHAEDCTIYRVVTNSEGTYCIWPSHLPTPEGWSPTGFLGTGKAALNQVAELWRAKIAAMSATRRRT